MAGSSATALEHRSEIDRGQRFLLFVGLFALYVLVHEALEASRIADRGLGRNVVDLVVIGTAVGVLVNRRSWAWPTGLAAALVVQKWIHMPKMPNHVLFTFFLAALLLVLLIIQRMRRSEQHWWEGLASVGAPAMRSGLIAVYGFAALHKLNVDYLDIAVSCGALAGRGVRLGGVEEVELVNTLAVFGSLVVEGGLALGLAFRRTRVAALVVGLGFHLVLGIPANTAVTSFTLLIVPLYVLFVPLELLGRMVDRVTSTRTWNRITSLPRPLLGGAALAPWVLGALVQHSIVGRVTAIVIVSSALLLLLRELVAEPRLALARDEEARTPFATAVVGVVLVLLTMNAASPYIGFKTQTSFAMYSNLRTEGGESNHLFLPTVALVSDDAEHLVQVIEATSPLLQGLLASGDAIPRFELRRAATRDDSADFRVVYRDLASGDIVRVARDGAIDPAGAVVLEDVGLLEGKLRLFRPIDPLDRPQRCRH